MPWDSPVRQCHKKKKKRVDHFPKPGWPSIFFFFLETQQINYEAVAEMKAEALWDLKVAFDWMHYKEGKKWYRRIPEPPNAGALKRSSLARSAGVVGMACGSERSWALAHLLRAPKPCHPKKDLWAWQYMWAHGIEHSPAKLTTLLTEQLWKIIPLPQFVISAFEH